MNWLDALLDDARLNPPPVKATPVQWTSNAYTGTFTFRCSSPDCDKSVTLSASTVTHGDFDPNRVICPDCALDMFERIAS
jgi:hypothetical protein